MIEGLGGRHVNHRFSLTNVIHHYPWVERRGSLASCYRGMIAGALLRVGIPSTDDATTGLIAEIQQLLLVQGSLNG